MYQLHGAPLNAETVGDPGKNTLLPVTPPSQWACKLCIPVIVYTSDHNYKKKMSKLKHYMCIVTTAYH